MFRDLLKDSYRIHPSFQTRAEPRSFLNKTALDEFNRVYRSLSENQLGGDQEAKNILLIAQKSLAGIFGALRDGAEDNYEKWFLQELEAEISRLLENDFLIFRRRRRMDVWTRKIFKKHKAYLSKLYEKKFFIDRLPIQTVEIILKLGAANLAEFKRRAQQGRLTREDLSFNSGPEAWEIKKVLHKQFDKMGVIDAVSEYMQEPMEAAGQAFELSVSQAQWWRNGFHGLPRTPDTLYAHLDESIGVPKAIVYLTDVALANGPTGYYENLYEKLDLNPLQEMVGRVLANVGGSDSSPLKPYYNKAYHQSMTSEGFRRHFMRLPEEIRFNSHFGWDIMPGSEAESLMVKSEKKMTGPAGTFIVFDGARLLHRGGLVDKGERVALQVIFNSTKPEKIRRRILRQYLNT